jgi:hypothetical protein
MRYRINTGSGNSSVTETGIGTFGDACDHEWKRWKKSILGTATSSGYEFDECVHCGLTVRLGLRTGRAGG